MDRVYYERNNDLHTHTASHQANVMHPQYSYGAYANEVKYANEPKYVNIAPPDAVQPTPSGRSTENEYPEMGSYNSVTQALRVPPPVPVRNMQNFERSKRLKREWSQEPSSQTKPEIPARNYTREDAQTQGRTLLAPKPNGIAQTNKTGGTEVVREGIAQTNKTGGTEVVREEDLVDGWQDEESSDIDEIDGKRTKHPHARFGIVGVILIVLAASLLVVPVVLSSQPWNNMQGSMVAGIVLLIAGILLIIANLIWCGRVNAQIDKIMENRKKSGKLRIVFDNYFGLNSNSLFKRLSSKRNAARPAAELNNNSSSSNEYVMSKSIAALKQQALRSNEHTQPAAQHHALPPKIITADIPPENKHKKKKSRRMKAIDFPRTSTKKELMEPPLTDTDSGPENLNADALRARLRSDPRYSVQKLRQHNPHANYGLESQRQDEQNRETLSADYVEKERGKSEGGDRGVATPHSNKDSGYSGSVNGLLEHVEQFDNRIPQYPPPPSGLLAEARESYSKYIHGATVVPRRPHHTMQDTRTQWNTMYSAQTATSTGRDITPSVRRSHPVHTSNNEQTGRSLMPGAARVDSVNSHCAQPTFHRDKNHSHHFWAISGDNVYHHVVSSAQQQDRPATVPRSATSHTFSAYAKRDHVSSSVSKSSAVYKRAQDYTDSGPYTIEGNGAFPHQYLQRKHNADLQTYI